MKAVILTPTPVEQEAVRRYLGSKENNIIAGTLYVSGRFQGLYQNFEIITLQTGSRNSLVALATEKAIQAFNPALILLVGIAGGVKDVAIGDIVVGTKAYGYEVGKTTPDGFKARPVVVNSSQELIALAQHVAMEKNWQEKLRATSPDSKVIFGPIASGEKVITSKNSFTLQILNEHFNDTVALEMEAIGFGETMLFHPQIRFINIRSISDLLDQKAESDANGSQELAANNAAAFAFALLNQLNCSFHGASMMDVKSLSKEVVAQALSLIMQKVEEGVILPGPSAISVLGNG